MGLLGLSHFFSRAAKSYFENGLTVFCRTLELFLTFLSDSTLHCVLKISLNRLIFSSNLKLHFNVLCITDIMLPQIIASFRFRYKSSYESV